jgi:hypothetical protein
MDRISGANYLTLGGIRIFQDLNLSTNTPGTYPNALWFTGAQESILAPVTGTGQTLTDADNTQLFKAIKRIASGNITPVTASGTLTADNAGVVFVNATAGAIALALPLAASAGGVPLKIVFVRTDSTANAVTATFQTGDTNITGGTTAFTVPPAIGTVVGMRTVVGDGVSHWLDPNGSTLPAASTATTQAGTSTTSAVTPAGLAGTMLGGVGQAWTDVTGSRVPGTTYTNSTGRPIVVNIYAQSTAGSDHLGATINGTLLVQMGGAVSGSTAQGIIFVVPNGATYSVQMTSGTISVLGQWSELR